MSHNMSVAVLGSCATRDNFNSRFNENYKDFYECVLTQNQTSIISLMSEPAVFAEEDLGELSDYQKWNVRTDLNKEFLSLLKEQQPEYLILDFFADIHFGCLELSENRYITNNRWMVWKTPFYKALKESGGMKEWKLEKNTEEYLDLWKKSIDSLSEFIRSEVPQCKVIIHKARNVEFLLKKGEAKPYIKLSESGRVARINVKQMNKLWNTMDEYAASALQARTIGVKSLFTYEKHPWGPFYVHYTKEYYREFLVQLHQIVLQDSERQLLSDSVPASLTQEIRQDLERSQRYQRLTGTWDHLIKPKPVPEQAPVPPSFPSRIQEKLKRNGIVRFIYDKYRARAGK
ncbi:DUF6270 domain-containing protein [Peribacillus sp. SCS-26]|uniref:DUF6270 domain-containing protein n=1 Tax=Paraperibacillus marinus TaxID=3115295 RepID=UPI00390675C5